MKNKIGVYVCHCGGNISDVVDVNKVREEAEKMGGVAIAKHTIFACADSSQKEIAEDIKNLELDGIVVASCSPKLHLLTFRAVAERAGLNPYNYVHANIREQSSWAHSDDKKGATEKAISLVRSAVERVSHSVAMDPVSISAQNIVAVVGAGVAGMKAAIELADMGSQVYLIEKSHYVGGRTSQWGKLFLPGETGKSVVENLYQEVKKRQNINLFTGAELVSKKGSVGNFEIEVKITSRGVKKDADISTIEKAIQVCPEEVSDEFNFGLTNRKALMNFHPGQYPEVAAIDAATCTKCGKCAEVSDAIDLNLEEERITLQAGSLMITTGFDPYEPEKSEFGYGDYDNVITLPQLERHLELSNGKDLVINGKKIRSMAYIYCVGSRQPKGENKYCSRYCCTSAVHSAIKVREKVPEMTVYHINRGIRTYGKQEVLYEQSSKNGDIYIQFTEDTFPEVSSNGKHTVVKVNDLLTAGKELEIEPDLVVLVTGMTPRKNDAIGETLKLPRGRDKFYNEIHPKLRPVETTIDGVLIAGVCQGPKNITETVKSSLAASAKTYSLLKREEITLEPIMAKVDAEKCEVCDNCSAACPFGAFEFVEENGKKVAHVNESNCKGCGMCLPVCPTDAIELSGYTNSEIEGMIDALTESDY